MNTISLLELRRHIVAWQGYITRNRQATDEDVANCVQRLSCVQLDSISTVERSHILVLTGRVGDVDSGVFARLLTSGSLFEYWAHEASLLSVCDWPLLSRRMRERRVHHWWGPVIDSDAKLARRIVSTIRERGPLGSRHFEGRGGGGMWRLKPAKRMLDALWTAGKLVVSSRQGFQRLYDLPERVLSPAVLAAPVPTEKEMLRQFIIRAVNARGAVTARGILDHYRLKGGVARIMPHIRSLCCAGEIREYTVSDGGLPVYLPSACDPIAAEPPAGGILLSPFENLLWDRAFTRRVFEFDHVIEVYKRKHERKYGYYVLPFLLGDQLVGRADLKANRQEGHLYVNAFHLQPGVRSTVALRAHFERAVARLARTLGLVCSQQKI